MILAHSHLSYLLTILIFILTLSPGVSGAGWPCLARSVFQLAAGIPKLLHLNEIRYEAILHDLPCASPCGIIGGNATWDVRIRINSGDWDI